MGLVWHSFFFYRPKIALRPPACKNGFANSKKLKKTVILRSKRSNSGSLKNSTWTVPCGCVPSVFLPNSIVCSALQNHLMPLESLHAVLNLSKVIRLCWISRSWGIRLYVWVHHWRALFLTMSSWEEMRARLSYWQVSVQFLLNKYFYWIEAV